MKWLCQKKCKFWNLYLLFIVHVSIKLCQSTDFLSDFIFSVICSVCRLKIRMFCCTNTYNVHTYRMLTYTYAWGVFAGQLLGNFPLSGFTRCLFLQALLEDEKILVVLKSSEQNGKFMTSTKVNNGVYHPSFTGGRDTQVMLVSLHTTISEVTSKVTSRSPSADSGWNYCGLNMWFSWTTCIPLYTSWYFSDLSLLPGQFLEKAAEKSDEIKKDSLSNYTEMADYLSSSVGRCHPQNPTPKGFFFFMCNEYT